MHLPIPKPLKFSFYLFICLLFGNINYLNAQNQDYISANSFLPPSPNSASLGKYGGLNLGLSSGTIQHTVPLTNLTSGRLNLPISLSYSSNGVKVDEIASRVGTSWNLEAGGVITRTVYGESDENHPRVTAPDLPMRSRAFINFLDALVVPNGSVRYGDGEPDVFSFNFNGHSGRFILDANLNPILLTYSGLKIERIDDLQFAITTTEGVKYIFGGTNATESQSNYIVGQGCGRTFPNPTTTAFYLKTVIHPLGNTVNFLYSSVSYQYTAGINSSSSKRDLRMPPNSCKLYYLDPPPNQLTSCLVMYRTSTPVLNEISSSDGSRIKFSYKNRKDIKDVLLDYLEVYQPLSTTWLKKIQLEYSEVKSTNNPSVLDSRLSADSSLYYRPFLMQVKEIGKNSLKERSHKFSYYNMENITPRLSYAQDLYGFYNGRINNVSPFSLPSREQWQSVFPEATANRQISSSLINTGLLEKVIYPTGGSETIEYENNKIYTSRIVAPPVIYENINVSGAGTVGIGSLSSVAIPISENQEAFIGGNFDVQPGVTDPIHHLGTVKLLEDGVVLFSKTLRNGDFFREAVYLKQGSNYQISITASRGAKVNTAAGLEYRTGSSTTVYEDQLTAGIRVSKVTTNPNNGLVATKKYTYSKLNQTDVSSGISISKPIYERYRTISVPCASGRPKGENQPGTSIECDAADFYFYTINGSSINNIYSFSGAPVYYTTVIEEDWDGTQRKGGSEHHFEIFPDIDGQQLLGDEIGHAPLVNNSWKNGKEVYTHHFKEQNGSVIPVQKTYTHYKLDNRLNTNVKSYVALKKYTAYCQDAIPSTTEMKAYDFLIYEHNQMWIYADSIKTQLFDLNGQLAMEDLTVMLYNNPIHALSTSVVKNNSDGSQGVSYTSYPSDYADVNGFIKDMQTANLLSYPVEQVNYRQMGANRVIKSGGITKYKAGGKGLVDEMLVFDLTNPLKPFKFSNSAEGVLPFTGSLLSFSPDNYYKSRLKYDLYDANGNVLQYTSTNGSSNSYLWDYQGQHPVAEVKNAVQADVAYTSFEADANGNWNYSGLSLLDNSVPSGLRCYNLSGGALTKNGLSNNKEYIIMYWVKNSGQPQISGGTISTALVIGSVNGWTQYRRTINAATTVSLSGSGIFIDDVRLYTSDSQMNTYTYEPMVGLTSQTDQKGQTTYFEYDSLQQLMLIKDRNRSIVKSYNYNYKP